MEYLDIKRQWGAGVYLTPKIVGVVIIELLCPFFPCNAHRTNASFVGCWGCSYNPIYMSVVRGPCSTNIGCTHHTCVMSLAERGAQRRQPNTSEEYFCGKKGRKVMLNTALTSHLICEKLLLTNTKAFFSTLHANLPIISNNFLLMQQAAQSSIVPRSSPAA